MGEFGSSVAVKGLEFYFIEPYLASGLIFGSAYHQQHASNGYTYYENYNCISLLPCIGAYIKMFDKLKLNIEISVPTILNLDDNSKTTYFVPTI